LSTITVTLELQSDTEVVMHAQLLQAIHSHPAAPPAGTTAVYTGPQLVKDAPAAPPAPSAPSAPAVDRASVEEAFRAYYARVGTAAARALLDKYDAPFLKDVADARLADFVKEVLA
jgi:hypothetical protein